MTVRSVQELSDAWQITIDGLVIVPSANGGGGSSTTVHEVIDVDKQTGAASLAPQG